MTFKYCWIWLQILSETNCKFCQISKLYTPNTRKYGPEITPYLDTFHTVGAFAKIVNGFQHHKKCHLIRLTALKIRLCNKVFIGVFTNIANIVTRNLKIHQPNGPFYEHMLRVKLYQNSSFSLKCKQTKISAAKLLWTSFLPFYVINISFSFFPLSRCKYARLCQKDYNSSNKHKLALYQTQSGR